MGEIKELSVESYPYLTEENSKTLGTGNLPCVIAESGEQLLKTTSWQTSANKILGNIGNAFNISQIYLFPSQPPENPNAPQAHKRSAQTGNRPHKNLGVPSTTRKLINLEYWKARLETGDIIYGNTRNFERPGRTLLEIQNIKSFALLPIHVFGQWWGCISFNEHRWERNWSASTRLLLKRISTLFASAIEGEANRAQTAVHPSTTDPPNHTHHNRYTTLVNNTDDIIWSIDRNPRWNFLNPAARKIPGCNPLIENKQTLWNPEYRFQYANGEYTNALDRGYTQYNEHQQAIRMIGSLPDITEQKRNKHYLRQSREHLRNLASRELSIREEERQRLSRELHDEFAQILTALKMDLNWLKTKLPHDMELLHERTTAMQNIIDVTMQRVREIATELRPALLDELGLSAAIEWQVKQFCDRTGCRQTLHIDIDNNKLPHDLQITIFRIFQEALANIGRHAKATAIEIQLSEDHSNLLLEIKDNGIGFATEKLHSIDSIGLTGMRERASAFGGHMHILTRPEHGTRVFLKIPLNN